MEEIMRKTQKKTLEEIMKFAQLLSAKQQEEALKQMRKMYLTNLARLSDESIVPNDITMEEIVAETKAAREERSKKNARN